MFILVVPRLHRLWTQYCDQCRSNITNVLKAIPFLYLDSVFCNADSICFVGSSVHLPDDKMVDLLDQTTNFKLEKKKTTHLQNASPVYLNNDFCL